MSLYLRVILIILAIFLAILMFFFFMVYNFPYRALIQRVNYYLKKEANTSLEVTAIKYHPPNVWLINGLDLYLPGEIGKVSLYKVKIQLNILNFSRYKGIELLANNIKIDGGGLLKANLESLNLYGNFILSNIKKDPLKNIKNVRISLNNGRVKSIEYSGFKLSNFSILNIFIELLNKDDRFGLDRGMINSDVFKGKVEGSFSKSYINLKIHLLPSRDFFIKYPDLKPMLESIVTKRGINFDIKGDIRSPQIKFVKE